MTGLHISNESAKDFGIICYVSQCLIKGPLLSVITCLKLCEIVSEVNVGDCSYCGCKICVSL